VRSTFLTGNRFKDTKRTAQRLSSLLPRALARGAGYEGFLSTAISACSIDVYCSSLVANAFL
jgi:hypothetical protein